MLSRRLLAGRVLRAPIPALALAGLALVALAARPAAAVDLIGTWYVLIHYQDANSTHPDAWRWDDRVWKFEMQGSRLHWVEYPLVIFNDEQGRFEHLGTNRASRVVSAWEPDEKQMAEIRSGLQVNSRGTKEKSLRKASGGKEWKTVGSMRVMSASTVGYFEDWNISALPDAPVFTRDDVLGSARAEGLEGRTQYTTTEVLDGGNELRGKFVRDGTRVGRFRMIRSGDTRGIETAAKTDSERWQRSAAGMLPGLDLGSITAGDVQKAAAAGELTDQDRNDIRASIREQVEKSFRERNLSPREHRDDVDRMTREIEHMLLDEGRSVEEIQKILLQRYGGGGR